MTSSQAKCAARWTWVAVFLVAVAGAGCSETSLSCPAGQAPCGNACVNLQTDTLHCGACNIMCNAGASCTAGNCACPATLPDVCALECVNKQTSTANCGTCGHACGLGACQAEACVCNPTPATVALCPANPAAGTCLDTATSAANCGACGIICIPGEVCTASTCVCNAPRQVCGTGTAAVCTSTSTDSRNCGACGHACAAGQACSAGTCAPICSAGLAYCSGSCVDLKTDPANCGACNNPCGAGKSCSGGQCSATCLTVTCGGTCCQGGTGCCPAGGSGTACQSQHKNFVGTPQEQSYFDCTPLGTYNIVTAQKAASVWAPSGTPISTQRSCPDTGGSTCVVWQKPSPVGADVACGVWCYAGAYAGTALINSGYACPCPTQQGINWF